MKPSGYLLVTALLGVGLLLSGCDRGQQDQPAAKAADQDYVARMAEQHADDTPVPSPAAGMEPAQPVQSQVVQYATVGGQTVNGYLSWPEGSDGALPGLIVIHEWWGLNDNIRAVSRRLAGEGYVTLAVDLYGGQSATDPDGARKLMSAVFAETSAAEDNLRQAYSFLSEQTQATRIGVIGWCFGGSWSLRTALLLPTQLSAAVIYYGQPVEDEAALAKLQMPVIGFYGGQDKGITPDSVRQFEATMKKLGKDIEVHIYPDANHAFANPSGQNYNPVAASDAWARTVKFLEQNMHAPMDENVPDDDGRLPGS